MQDVADRLMSEIDSKKAVTSFVNKLELKTAFFRVRKLYPSAERRSMKIDLNRILFRYPDQNTRKNQTLSKKVCPSSGL